MQALQTHTPHIDALLLLAGYLDRTPTEDAALASHLKRIERYDLLWELAHDNRIAPRVYQELQRLDLLDRLPDDIRARFAQQDAQVRTSNRARLAAARGILSALAASGLPVAVVKGVALGATLYDNPAYKRMNDLDLFVRKRDLEAIQALYAEHGFFPIAERVGGSPEQQLKLTHHLPPYVNADFSCMIGTDWDFRPPLLRHDFELDRVWERTVPLRLDGIELRTLGLEDRLHHLCVHLERFRTGVRDIMDLHNLIFAHSAQIDWARFKTLVQRAKSHTDVYYALRFSQAHRPHPEVADLLGWLAPHVPQRVKHLASRRTRSPRVLVRICSRQLSTIEKRVSFFNATQVFPEKLPLFARGWGGFLWPDRADAYKVCAIVEPTRRNLIRARLGAPVQLGSAVAAELGAPLLAGLAVKSVVDLCRAALPVGPKRDLNQFALELGVDLAQLKAAQAQYQ